MGKVSGKKKSNERRRQKRQQEKALKRRKTRKAYTPKERPLMSRKDDMAFIDQQLQELQDQIKAIAEEHEAAYGEITEKIQAVIKEAGIFDEIESLEKERGELLQSNQARINDIQSKGQELLRTRAFLEKRAGDPEEEAAPAVEDADCEDADCEDESCGEEEPERKAVVKKKAVSRKKG